MVKYLGVNVVPVNLGVLEKVTEEFEKSYTTRPGYNLKIETLNDKDFKVCLLLSGSELIPLFDLRASQKDIDTYCQTLTTYADFQAVRESKAKNEKRKKDFETRWRRESKALNLWVAILRRGQRYLSDLEEKNSLDWYSARDENFSKPLKVTEFSLSYQDIEKDLRVVADTFYYQDLKVCSTKVTPEELTEFGDSCNEQAEVGEMKYKVTGDSADNRYYLEKKLKARVNRCLALKLMKDKKSLQGSGISKSVFYGLRELTGLDENGVLFLWRVNSHKAYVEEFERTGEWTPPEDAEKVLSYGFPQFFEVLNWVLRSYDGRYQNTYAFQNLLQKVGVKTQKEEERELTEKVSVGDRRRAFWPSRNFRNRESGVFIHAHGAQQWTYS